MDALLEVLLPSLQLTTLPVSSGERVTEFFTWALYQTSISAPGVGTFTVDLALAELEGVPHLVLLQAEEGEHITAELYDKIFIPVVDAFAPLK